MEILHTDLEKILARQTDLVIEAIDNRFTEVTQEFNDRLDGHKHDLDDKFKKYTHESEDRMQRYTGILSEDFKSKLQTVLEYVKDIPDMKKLVEVTFDEVGKEAVKFTT